MFGNYCIKGFYSTKWPFNGKAPFLIQGKRPYNGITIKVYGKEQNIKGLGQKQNERPL